MSLSILIADDAKFSRNILKGLLNKYLKDVKAVSMSEAATGLQALELIRSQPVDVLFLDIHMPELDGFELMKALRAEGYQLKIAICSADFQEETIRRVHELGATTFISKIKLNVDLPLALKAMGVL